MNTNVNTRLRLAAALGYHLPAAVVSVTGDAGFERLVAPTSLVKADLHPGEFRDLVGLYYSTGNDSDLASALRVVSVNSLEARLLDCPPTLEHVGAGVYQTMGPDRRGSFCLATTLFPDEVERSFVDEPRLPTLNVAAALACDEVLDITIAVFEFSGNDPIGMKNACDLAVSTAASCAVSETFMMQVRPV